jgi:hypothetical protein
MLRNIPEEPRPIYTTAEAGNLAPILLFSAASAEHMSEKSKKCSGVFFN